MTYKFLKLEPTIAVKTIPHSFKWLFCLIMLSAFGGINSGFAESGINVYSATSKLNLGTVASDSEWDIVERQQQWNLVRFSQPIVPIWVSSDYVNIDQGQATVRVSRLNARVEPSTQAPVLGKMPLGHTSPVLANSKGFIQIYCPDSWLFSLRSDGQNTQVTSTTAAQDNSSKTWKMSKVTSSQPVQKKAPTAVSDVTDNVTEVAENRLAQSHRIAPGDTISLLVFGEPELSIANVRIPQSGVVSFPLIGATEVQGRTTAEIEQLLATKLAGGYVRNPRLSVTIDGYRPIFIRGAVARTGEFPFTEGLTIVKALSLAGGIKNSATANGVSILRDGEVVHDAASAESQFEVLSGDIISVEEELGVGDESTSYVYLHGEVQKPGEYEYRRGLTVEKAVVLAGGFTLRASKRKISLSRIVEGELEPEKLRKVKLYLPVKPGDIIDVGASWF